MKKKLRIGNLVDWNGEIAIVSQLLEKDVFFKCGEIDLYDAIKPIQITEKWLLNFGFEERIEDEYFSKWFIGENLLTKDWLFMIKQHKDENIFFFQNGFLKIKYVHQLQNLYLALTGKELHIKLNDKSNYEAKK